MIEKGESAEHPFEEFPVGVKKKKYVEISRKI